MIIFFFHIINHLIPYSSVCFFNLFLFFQRGGGAVTIACGSGTFTACSFIDNESADYGGGVAIWTDGSGTFISCSWSENTAPTDKVSTSLGQPFIS